jgi:PPM family protein phosphatase
LANIFERLFRRREVPETEPLVEVSTASPTTAAGNSEIPTVPLGLKNENGAAEGEETYEQFDNPPFEIGYAQSIGRQREHNEDSILVINAGLSSNESMNSFGLYIVADGMGGHKHGEVASGIAVRAMASQITQKIMMALISPQPITPKESIQEIVDHSVQEAHKQIIKEAPGSGTTLTALLVLENNLTIAHVGDSRAYAIRPDGEQQVLTRDHSLVMRMMELGQLTEEEAAIHPQRNVLYRALGQGEPFTPDITTSPLPEDGYLLLCSDGLWSVIPKELLSRIIIESETPQDACELLIYAANEAGGPDNISAILIHIPG